MRIKLERMWVNQPSTLQQYHNEHGKNVLADMTMEGDWCIVYFTEGDVHSMEMYKIALSKGWKHERAFIDG
jgi:hypothetical protein